MIIAFPTYTIDYGGVCMMQYYLSQNVLKGNL